MAMWVGTVLADRPQRDRGGLLLGALHLDGVLLGDLLLRDLRVEDLVDREDVRAGSIHACRMSHALTG